MSHKVCCQSSDNCALFAEHLPEIERLTANRRADRERVRQECGRACLNQASRWAPGEDRFKGAIDCLTAIRALDLAATPTPAKGESGE